jgi:hypothetical protein
VRREHVPSHFSLCILVHQLPDQRATELHDVHVLTQYCSLESGQHTQHSTFSGRVSRFTRLLTQSQLCYSAMLCFQYDCIVHFNLIPCCLIISALPHVWPFMVSPFSNKLWRFLFCVCNYVELVNTAGARAHTHTPYCCCFSAHSMITQSFTVLAVHLYPYVDTLCQGLSMLHHTVCFISLFYFICAYL